MKILGYKTPVFYKVFDSERRLQSIITKASENELTEEQWLQVVSCFVINKDNEVLIEKRVNKGLSPGMLDLCSGHIDNFEVPTQAMVRELEEELGIELYHTSDGEKVLELKRHSAKYPWKIQVEFAVDGLVGYNSNGGEEEAEVSCILKISFDGGNTYKPFYTGSDGAVRGSGITNNSTTGEFTITRKKNKVMRFYAERTLTYEAVLITRPIFILSEQMQKAAIQTHRTQFICLQ